MGDDDDDKKPRPRHRVWGVLVGVILAVICNQIPDKYQTACEAISEFSALGGC